MTDNPLDLIKRLTEALRIQADDFGTDAQLLKDANSFIARNSITDWSFILLNPIPLSERQPTEDDCDSGKMCWFYRVGSDDIGDWTKQRLTTFKGYETYSLTHWLPHWALPSPIMTPFTSK